MVKVADLETVPDFAVNVTTAASATGVVLAANFAEDAPAGTWMLAGTWTTEELDDKLTTKPPLGAAPLRVTTPFAEFPPAMVDGEIETAVSEAGVMVSVAECARPRVAVIEAETVLLTPDVWIVKVATDAPDSTVTDAGTVALPELDTRSTAMPPAGATPFSVTVPVDVIPPITLAGLTETADTEGGSMANTAEALF